MYTHMYVNIYVCDLWPSSVSPPPTQGMQTCQLSTNSTKFSWFVYYSNYNNIPPPVLVDSGVQHLRDGYLLYPSMSIAS